MLLLKLLHALWYWYLTTFSFQVSGNGFRKLTRAKRISSAKGKKRDKEVGCCSDDVQCATASLMVSALVVIIISFLLAVVVVGIVK
jgi:hypothetical protein